MIFPPPEVRGLGSLQHVEQSLKIFTEAQLESWLVLFLWISTLKILYFSKNLCVVGIDLTGMGFLHIAGAVGQGDDTFLHGFLWLQVSV